MLSPPSPSVLEVPRSKPSQGLAECGGRLGGAVGEGFRKPKAAGVAE